MSGSAHKYVSLFRMDGKPILPPLMTSEKRREMQKYRAQAVRLEHQNTPYATYTELKSGSKPEVHDFSQSATDKAIQESYLLLTKLVLNDKDRTAEIKERLKKLNKSETIIFDNITNAVIVPLAADKVTTAIPAINIDPPTPLTRRSFADSIESNDFESNSVASLPLTPAKRSATSPALNQLSELVQQPCLSDNIYHIEQPTLVRSNSFTLKTPSRALVEHMRQQELQEQRKKSTTASYVGRDTVESKAKRQPKACRNERKISASDIKSKRSPYEQRLDTKPKLARNLKKTVINKKDTTTSPTRVLNLQRKVKTVTADVNALQQKTVFTTHDVKAENTQKFLQLLAEQQQEQEHMLELFALQRNQLLQELECQNSTERSFNNKTSPGLQSSPQTATNKSPPSSRKVKVNDHSRRKLFSDNYSSATPCSTPLSSGKMLSFAFEQNKRSIAVDENLLKEQAATKINACARGYLVRRLYRCEQIQRVVETIKDTLYFVISLHYETKQNPEEASSLTNKELKTRLLQQLLAASQTLHMIFFETSLKERLDIIARDRKILKMKMLAKGTKKERK